MSRHQVENYAGAPSVAPSLDVAAVFATAAAHYRAGRLAKAVILYDQIVSNAPNLPEVWLNLGVALAALGKTAKAEAAYRRAIMLRPAYPEAHSNLGNMFRAAGKLAEAEAAHRHAIGLKPDLAEAHANLGVVLADLGKFDEAQLALRRAIQLKPQFAEACNDLGNLLKKLGKFDRAEAAYRQAIALRPDYPEVHSNLGNMLREAGRLAEAEAAHRHAISLRPDLPELYLSLGATLADLGRRDEAENAFRRAILLKPDYADAHNNLGLVLKEVGRLAEAHDAAEQAVRLAPRNATYLYTLAGVRRFAADDPYMATMEKLTENAASLSTEEQIDLHFALAKAYADRGRSEEAFRQLLAGNALKRGQIAYDEAAALATLKRIQESFSSELIQTMQGVGEQSSVPIFIVGMLRSGTTLAEQIIASHPQVFGGGELKQFARAVASTPAKQGWRSTFPEMAATMSGEDFRRLGARYVHELERLAPGAARITDKMPANYLFVGLIHLALPKAIIIHTIRDPLDTCVSCFSTPFAEPQPHTYDLAELGRYYRHYQALMAHWRSVLPPGRILDVHYEDLVADQEATSRRIIAHCGLEWDARCLDFHRTKRPVLTASATQVRQPIYTSSIGRWRAYEAFLRPLLAELNN